MPIIGGPPPKPPKPKKPPKPVTYKAPEKTTNVSTEKTVKVKVIQPPKGQAGRAGKSTGASTYDAPDKVIQPPKGQAGRAGKAGGDVSAGTSGGGGRGDVNVLKPDKSGGSLSAPRGSKDTQGMTPRKAKDLTVASKKSSAKTTANAIKGTGSFSGGTRKSGGGTSTVTKKSSGGSALGGGGGTSSKGGSTFDGSRPPTSDSNPDRPTSFGILKDFTGSPAFFDVGGASTGGGGQTGGSTNPLTAGSAVEEQTKGQTLEDILHGAKRKGRIRRERGTE
jgi:hypothetical protein